MIILHVLMFTLSYFTCTLLFLQDLGSEAHRSGPLVRAVLVLVVQGQTTASSSTFGMVIRSSSYFVLDLVV